MSTESSNNNLFDFVIESRKRPHANNENIKNIDNSEKLVLQIATLRLSFVNPDDSFINIKWISVNDALNKISCQWEFLAFGSDHKSAIINASNQDVINKLKETADLIIGEDVFKIKFEELKNIHKRGIIFNKFLIPLSIQEILEALKSHDIKEIYKIEKINKLSGEKFFTGSVILVFHGSKIPSTVEIGKVKISVNNLTPRPMICNHCSLLGHTQSNCNKKDSELCRRCFYSHEHNERCNKVCKHCRGDHFSNDKECSVLIREIQILKVKEAHNINYFDAKAILKNIVPEVQIEKESYKKSNVEELLKKNEMLFESYKKEREEKEKIFEELKQANLNISDLNIQISNLQTRNTEQQQQFDESQELLSKALEKNQLDIAAVSQKNIEALDQYNALSEKNKDLQNKFKELEKSKTEQHKIFKEFINSSDLVNKAYNEFAEKKHIEGHIFFATYSKTKIRSLSKDRKL